MLKRPVGICAITVARRNIYSAMAELEESTLYAAPVAESFHEGTLRAQTACIDAAERDLEAALKALRAARRDG